MKKIIIAAVAASALLLAGCASAPPPPKKTVEILEHQNTAFGGNLPFWVTMESQDIQAMPEWKDYYAFKFESSGQDERGATLAATQIDAAQTIAQQVSLRVQAKFAGAEVGDRNKVETYMENIVKNMADTTFSGLKREGSFWVRVRMFNDDGTVKAEEYRVRVFYSIPRKLLDDQIKKIIDGVDGVDQPKTEEERTARQRVREALNEGF